MFTGTFEEFGLSRAHGTFCSMEHAVEWASSSPTLAPRKHPFKAEATKSNAVKGCLVFVALVFVLVCVVVGLVATARFLF